MFGFVFFFLSFFTTEDWVDIICFLNFLVYTLSFNQFFRSWHQMLSFWMLFRFDWCHISFLVVNWFSGQMHKYRWINWSRWHRNARALLLKEELMGLLSRTYKQIAICELIKQIVKSIFLNQICLFPFVVCVHFSILDILYHGFIDFQVQIPSNHFVLFIYLFW